MRISGQFILNDVTYTVHRIELKGYTRLDIMEDGGNFQIEPEKVLFSYYKKKTQYTYGNTELFDCYNSLKQTLTSMKATVTPEVKWEDGKLIKTTHKVANDNCFMTMINHNSLFESAVYRLNNMSLIEVCVDPDFSLILEPQNSKQYSKVEFKSSVIDYSLYGDIIPLEVLRQRNDLSWEELVDYHVMRTNEEAREYIAFIKTLDTSANLGFDFETTGLTFTCYYSEEIVGIVISHEYNQSRYFAFRHEDYPNLDIEIMNELLDALWDYVKTAHNKKFERKVLMSIGYRYFPIKHDSMQAAIINDPEIRSGSHSLKTKGAEVTGWEFLELSNIYVDKSKINFAKLRDPELIKLYACPDADSARKVLYDELGKMPSYLHGIYDLECELADLKAEQEYWGFRVDYEPFLKDYEVCSEVRKMLEDLFKKTIKSEINLASGDQLAALLYGKLKCPVLVKTATGKPGTGAKALKKLAKEARSEVSTAIKKDIVDSNGDIIIKAKDLNAAKYPSILILNAYKDYYKLESAFYSRFANDSNNGRYFSWVNQNGARSGRQSSPMHQLPKKMKAHIKADSEDHVIVDADWSQVELRIMASYSGEKKLMEMMRDPNTDIHRAIAEIITGVPMWAISAAMRQLRKATNFGVVYQISGRGLAEQIYGVGATKKQIRECADAILEFYRIFKRIKMFNDRTRARVESKGVAYTKFNRARPFPKIFEIGLTNDIRESIFRQGINTPIQGTAADIMKMAEVKLTNWIREKGWDEIVDTPQGRFPKARVMISAHDEVVMSMHKTIVSNIPEVLLMVRECMELQIEDWVPLFTATCIVDNWAEGKEDKYGIPVDLRDKIIEEGTLRLGDNPKAEMLKIINDFRDDELRGYMESVIESVGTLDAEDIHKKVQHPSLTHDLIARFGPSKSWFAQHGELTHLETIKFAVEGYLKWRLEDHTVDKVEKEVKKERAVVDFGDFITEGIALSEELYDFDADGNVIGEDGQLLGDEELEEEYEVWTEEEEEDYRRQYTDEAFLVFEMFNAYVCDASLLSKEECDELLTLLFQYHDPNGFSEVKILWEGDLLDTGIRCEKLDNEKIAKWILEKKKVMIDAM